MNNHEVEEGIPTSFVDDFNNHSRALTTLHKPELASYMVYVESYNVVGLFGDTIPRFFVELVVLHPVTQSFKIDAAGTVENHNRIVSAVTQGRTDILLTQLDK